MAQHNELGKKGEDLALNYLRSLGYVILQTNWRYSRAEVDIIAKEEDVLVFVEVKTRSSDMFGLPEEFVDAKKEQLIMEAANEFMKKIGHEWEIRFDLVGVLMSPGKPSEISHIKDAFFPNLG